MLSAGASQAAAETQLASLFSDGMVLQCDQPVPIWGWTKSGVDVSVSFAGQTVTGRADEAGKFVVRLDSLEVSSDSQTLTVQAAGETVRVEDVLVGEVWLCSGQSNMKNPVKFSLNPDKEIAEANYPLIRLFETRFAVNLQPQQRCEGQWHVCSPETVGEFSATAYYFGRALHRGLNVPIGLVHASQGSTCIEAWSPPASLAKFPSVMTYQADFDARAAVFQEAEPEDQFKARLKKWEQEAAAANAAGKKKVQRPSRTLHPHLDKNYPGNLYNAMIRPLVPYGIRGAIWYQGERNAKTNAGAMLYRDLLENLTLSWRKDWDSEFSFYAVQLVNFKKPTTRPVDDTPWVFIRESILQFQNEVPNTGMAVGIDVGEARQIHPKNKQAIGDRLARQALAKTYGKSIVADGPLYASVQNMEGKLVIRFASVGSGLAAKDGGSLKSFAIAGADRKFVSAQAEVAGETVVVSSPEVNEPVAVRYAWSDNPEGCNLINRDGLPASPFRTDSWEPTEE